MLKGKNIAVVGATGGMGTSLSLSLSVTGASLALFARSSEKLERLKAKTSGNNIFTYPIDLQHAQSMREAVLAFAKDFKYLDALIYASGVIYRDEEISQNASLEEEQMQINFTSIRQLTSLLLPYLTEFGSDIYFINSSAGITEKKGYTYYSRSKSELKRYADALRNEVNPKGIRVTSLYPGNTATPMQEKVKKESHLPYLPEKMIQPDDITHLILALLTLPRTSEVTAIHVRPTNK